MRKLIANLSLRIPPWKDRVASVNEQVTRIPLASSCAIRLPLNTEQIEGKQLRYEGKIIKVNQTRRRKWFFRHGECHSGLQIEIIQPRESRQGEISSATFHVDVKKYRILPFTTKTTKLSCSFFSLNVLILWENLFLNPGGKSWRDMPLILKKKTGSRSSNQFFAEVLEWQDDLRP